VDVDRSPLIIGSARRHGVADEDIIHCFDNPILIEDLDDDLVMLVGPDRAGRFLEVGVVVGDDGPVIVHAMEARTKYLR
jgi:hypothetical protein